MRWVWYWIGVALWYFPERAAKDTPPMPDARQREMFAYLFGTVVGLAFGGVFGWLRVSWYVYVACAVWTGLLVTYRMMVQVIREDRHRVDE